MVIRRYMQILHKDDNADDDDDDDDDDNDDTTNNNFGSRKHLNKLSIKKYAIKNKHIQESFNNFRSFFSTDFSAPALPTISCIHIHCAIYRHLLSGYV